jgi:hemerythrin superfamily protein
MVATVRRILVRTVQRNRTEGARAGAHASEPFQGGEPVQTRDDHDVLREREGPGEDVFALLERDHRSIRTLFDQIKLEMDDETEIARGLFAELRLELLAHAHIEEQIVYPAFEQVDELADMVASAREEHALIAKLIDEVLLLLRVDDEWQEKVLMISELVERHFEKEEMDAFPVARERIDAGRSREMAGRFLQLQERELGPIVEDSARHESPQAAAPR